MALSWSKGWVSHNQGNVRKKNSTGYKLAGWLFLLYATATPLLIQWVVFQGIQIFSQ
jgi:hypothetical protein